MIHLLDRDIDGGGLEVRGAGLERPGGTSAGQLLVLEGLNVQQNVVLV